MFSVIYLIASNFGVSVCVYVYFIDPILIPFYAVHGVTFFIHCVDCQNENDPFETEMPPLSARTHILFGSQPEQELLKIDRYSRATRTEKKYKK